MSALSQLKRAECLLLIVDVQERLAPHIAAHERLIARCAALMSAAREMDIPVIATEHCPSAIGPLIPSLRSRLGPGEVYEKTRFGAMHHPEFAQLVASTGRRQCIVAGMEAHVCVLQTALGLRRAGYDVFLVEDAVGSRTSRQDDRRLALTRMCDAGVAMMGTETTLFELAHAGNDPTFRSVLALVKSLP